MTDHKSSGGAVWVMSAVLLVAGGWAASADAATGIPPAVDVDAATTEAVGEAERMDSILGVAIPTSTTLQATLQQRRGRGGGGGGDRAARPRRGGGRAGQPGRGGGRVARPTVRRGRTVGVRGGRRYSPYYYGLGSPYGYGFGYPYYGGGYYGGYGGYGGSYSYTGSVRLKVKPRHAEVLVDGYYVGTVDDFDGIFQSLRLEPGPASIEVRAPGFEALSLDVRILPGRKITFEENMRAGDPGQAPPPSAARRPPARGLDQGAAVARPGPGNGDGEPGPQGGFDGQPPVFGGVRLRVEPRNAQVYVDGYYVGRVDDFDSGRGLPLESGPQRIEIRADGYESLQVEVRILPDETITYEGGLAPVSGR